MTPDPAHRVAIDAHARPQLMAGARLQTDRLTGQPVLLFPEGILKLNATGLAILELCDGHRSIADVLASLAGRFSVPADLLAGDVAEYLSRLVRRGLIQLMPAEGSRS